MYKYLFPVMEGTGNAPVWSVKICPVMGMHSGYTKWVRSSDVGFSVAVAWNRKCGVLCIVLVERILLRWARMCPRIVASNGGGCCRICDEVIDGNVVRNPASMALQSVVSVGENIDL